MPENLLGLFKILLLVLLYLFFARVLWAVWTEVRASRRAERATGPAGPSAPAPAAGLVLREPAERAGARFPLEHELTVGRSGACQIAVGDDTFASQLHARLYRDGDVTMVEDLGSTNGTWVNGERIAAPTVVHRGDSLQIGTTVLEVQ